MRRGAKRGDKLQVFHSIWGAIRSDFAEDSDKTRGLYAQLGRFVRDEAPCGSGPAGRSACELQQEVRRHLRRLLAQRLANLLNAEASPQAFGMYLTASVEPALVRDVLGRAIADVYLYRGPEQLVRQLEQLFADGDGDEGGYRLMVEAQLALFWHHQALHDELDAFLFAMAHMAGKIQSHHLYASLDAGLQRRVDAMQQALPAVLRLLFRAQGFCLLSRSDWEYLYTAITDEWNYGLNGRQVFTWHEQNYTDSAGQIRAFVQQPTANGQGGGPLFTLRGELFKWYLHVDPAELNRVGALRSGSPSSATSTWSVGYTADALVFRQRDLTMCATEKRDGDPERRLVRMLPGQLHSPPSQQCQWLPTPCA
ncbi:hypothetical protein KR018_005112 [Drosophila ironensis]|nr:hypothetical protein KR018_005112 [Drosophila ironensis]